MNYKHIGDSSKNVHNNFPIKSFLDLCDNKYEEISNTVCNI